MSFTRQDWFDRFVADLTMVVGALVERPAVASASSAMPDGGWIVVFEADKGARGSLSVQFDRPATEALTRRIMGMEIDPPDEAVVDTLKEICAQAAGAMVQQAPLAGTKLSIEAVNRAAGTTGPSPVLIQIIVDDMAPLRLALWGDVELVAAGKQPEGGVLPTSATPKLDVILDIDLPLMVRFGRTEMALRALTALGPGSVIDLGRSPDDPVEVLVSNQIVARGEVVIVSGNYGIRITEVMSPGERVRSMEAEF